MEWCDICMKYYEATTSAECPYCSRKITIKTTDKTDYDLNYRYYI